MIANGVGDLALLRPEGHPQDRLRPEDRVVEQPATPLRLNRRRGERQVLPADLRPGMPPPGH